MSDEQNEDKDSLTPITRRLLTAVEDIALAESPIIEYQHSLFCQVGLPRSPQNSRVFERHFGRASLIIEAGRLWDGEQWVERPLPSGPKPRLILIDINSELVRTRYPIVNIERTAKKYMARLGVNSDGGRNYTLFKDKMLDLVASRFILGFSPKEGLASTLKTDPIKRFEGWMTKEGEQRTLWPETLEVSREYLDSLIQHAVPQDPRALRGLAYSAMALDVYSLFARRLVTLENPVKVTWTQWHRQMGQEYASVWEFKKRFLEAVRAVLSVYPDAKVELVRGGLLLKPSPPPMRGKIAVSVGLADHVRTTLPAPPQEKPLNPETVAKFKAAWPNLDPYACRDDFDAWLEKLPERKPRQYDRAFLGFAKKWAIGKT
ncbi:MAG: hypothetical protein ACOYMG_21840 [Candidatus Methylumidiphilus sp.]